MKEYVSPSYIAAKLGCTVSDVLDALEILGFEPALMLNRQTWYSAEATARVICYLVNSGRVQHTIQIPAAVEVAEDE